MVSLADDLGVISDSEGRWWALPAEIEQTAASVTGLVHPGAAQQLIWGRASPDVASLILESGDRDTMARIIERGRQLDDGEPYSKFPLEHPAPSGERWADRILYDLLGPERRRQQAAMLEAIHRMLDLVYGAADPPAST
jgi:hypothetical protein